MLSAVSGESSCFRRVFENERVRYVGRESIAFIRNFREVSVLFADDNFAFGFFESGKFERFAAKKGKVLEV